MSTQTKLPFVDLSTTDGRNDVRKISVNRTERHHLVNIENIQLRPGTMHQFFNWRFQQENETDEDYEKRLEIPELAAAIYESNGPADPLRGDFKDGVFYVNGGERRYRAIKHLIYTDGLVEYPNGQPINLVEVFQNPKGFTDRDRRMIIFSSNNNLKYTAMEMAYGYLEIEQQEKMTHEEIAKLFGISRQTVNMYIKATTLPQEIQEKIHSGELTISAEVKKLRPAAKATDKTPHSWDDLSGKEPEKKEEKYKDGDEDEFLQQDNTVSKPSTKNLKEDSGEVIYKEPQRDIWARAFKMISSMQEQKRTEEQIYQELQQHFTINNNK